MIRSKPSGVTCLPLSIFLGITFKMATQEMPNGWHWYHLNDPDNPTGPAL